MVDEHLMAANPVAPFRQRYLRQYKDNGSEPRQLISIDQAAMLINSVLHSRDKAFLTLLFKTGMRLGELCSLDVGDLDLQDMSLVLKPTAKRSNRQLFFDHETARMLQAWLTSRPDISDGSPRSSAPENRESARGRLSCSQGNMPLAWGCRIRLQRNWQIVSHRTAAGIGW
jgi:integrase